MRALQKRHRLVLLILLPILLLVLIHNLRLLMYILQVLMLRLRAVRPLLFERSRSRRWWRGRPAEDRGRGRRDREGACTTPNTVASLHLPPRHPRHGGVVLVVLLGLLLLLLLGRSPQIPGSTLLRKLNRWVRLLLRLLQPRLHLPRDLFGSSPGLPERSGHGSPIDGARVRRGAVPLDLRDLGPVSAPICRVCRRAHRGAQQLHALGARDVQRLGIGRLGVSLLPSRRLLAPARTAAAAAALERLPHRSDLLPQAERDVRAVCRHTAASAQQPRELPHRHRHIEVHRAVPLARA
mmetsp:Transcript_51095/g.165377  ORF Transcript_51095/g.165377 Transcript_51095/m.165377 type:complete len:295 (-) Transcript_51095:603-1487(-)